MKNKGLYILVMFAFCMGLVTTTIKWQKQSVFADMQETKEVKRIALTYDDGPGCYTEKLLDGLRERDVKASFFLLGTNAESHRDTVERIHEEGHIIGNHTYSHIELNKVDSKEAYSEVTKTNNLIYSVIGEKVEYIRPPFGEWNDSLDKSIDMTVILWNLDPMDWSMQNADKISEYIIKNAKDGSIILMHDIFETSVEASFIVIDELKKQGFEFVTVEELTKN